MNIKKYLNPLFVFIGFAFLGWLSFLHPQVLLWLGTLTGFLSLLLVPAIFIFHRKLTLGEGVTSSFAQWLGKVCQGQLILLVFTLAATSAFFSEGSAWSKGVPFALFKRVLIDYMPWQWGVFPWGVIGLYGFMIAFLAYVKKESPYFYTLAHGIYPKSMEPYVKEFVVGALNTATSVTYGLMAATIILLFTYSIERILNISHLTIPFVTISILSFVTFWISMRALRKNFKRFIGHRLSFGGMYFKLIILLVMALILAAWGNTWVMQRAAEIYERAQCQQCEHYFLLVQPEVRLAALYWGWWLLWTPIAGSYLARISQGRTLGEFLFGIYIVPVLLGGIVFFWGMKPFEPIFLLWQQLSETVRYALLGGISLIGFYRMTSHMKNSSEFITGFMPESSSRHNRRWLQDGCKGQSVQKNAPGLLLGIVGVLFLHTVAGWYGIQFQITAVAAVVIWILYHGVTFFIFRFARNSPRT